MPCHGRLLILSTHVAVCALDCKTTVGSRFSMDCFGKTTFALLVLRASVKRLKPSAEADSHAVLLLC